MTRPIKAKVPFIETESSSSEPTGGAISVIPKSRRKKTSTVNKKRTAIDSIDVCKSPTVLLGSDDNKENDTYFSIDNESKKSFTSTPAVESYLKSLNVKAGNPLPPSIHISSLAHCSTHLNHRITQDSITTHIKEKKIEIINIARHCLQKVSLKDSESSIDFQIANLCVAVHCLRSVNTTIVSFYTSGDTRINAALDRTAQLYFLSISVAEILVGECYKASQTQDDDFKSLCNMYAAVHMCLGAYEGLGHLLQNIWNLPWMKLSCDHGEKTILSLFPVPDVSLIRKNNGGRQNCSKPSTVTDFKNVLRSITSLCSVLKALNRVALMREQPGNEFLSTISHQCQHVYANSFGERYLIHFFDSLPTAPFQIIISQSLMPWMMATLCFDELAEDIVNDVSNYCERNYKILWDTSKEIIHSHYKDKFRQYGFKLQEEAILLLLFHQPRGNNDVNSKAYYIRLRSLDKACTMASDSSSGYYQSVQGEVDDVLVRFHRNVGGVIDDVVLHNGAVNRVYIEYCARRAVHLSRSSCIMTIKSISCSCIFSRFPFPFSHTNDRCACHVADDHCVQALLMTYIALCSKDNLLDNTTIEQLAEDSLANYLALVDTLGGFAVMAPTDLLHVYRLMKILEIPSGPAQRFSDLEPFRLRALASIIREIFVPVILALSENMGTVSFAERDEIPATGMNILLKVIYILDKLEDFVASDHYICMTVNWLLKESAVSSDIKIKLLENSSKILSNIGKIRMNQESMGTCLMPFTASMELIASAFSLARKIEYKISDRCMHLAKVFSSLDMVQEAGIATALSVRYLVYELSLVADPIVYNGKDSDVLLFVADNVLQHSPISFSSSWPESFSTRCRALLCKLAQLLKNNRSTNSGKRFYAGSNSHVTGPFMKILNAVYSHGHLCPAKEIIYNALLGSSDESDSNIISLLSEVAKIFIWEFARTYGNCNTNESVSVQDTVNVVMTFFDEHVDLVSCIELNAIAAVAVSSDEKTKFQAKRFLCEALRRCQAAQGLGLISSIYYAGLKFAFLFLSSVDQGQQPLEQQREVPLLTSPIPSHGYDDIAQLCDKCLKSLIQNDFLSNKNLIDSAISLLTKSRLMLDYEGRSAGSILTSLPRIPSNWKNRLNISFLLYAHGVNLLGGENYHELETFFDEINVDRCFSDLVHNTMPLDLKLLSLSMRDGHFDECSARLCSDILMHAIRLEVYVNLSDFADLSSHIQDIDSLAHQLSDVDTGGRQPNSLKFVLQFVHELWINSCYFFLYGYYDKIGHLLRAFQYLRQCCYNSQRILKILECWHRRDDLPAHQLESLHRICCSQTFTFHLSARISNCYMRLSSLYSQLGDPYKSRMYSLWSTGTLGETSHAQVDSRESIVDLFGYANDSQRTYRHSRSVRSCVESFFLALPYATADEYMFQCFQTKLGVILNESFMRNRTNIDKDWIRETIKDLVTLGDAFNRNTRIMVDKELFYFRALNLSLQTKQAWSIKDDLDYVRLVSQLDIDSHSQWSFNSAFLDVVARIGQRLQNFHGDDIAAMERTVSILRGVASANAASSSTKALALYHVGLHFLDLARDSGELYCLWEGYSNRKENRNFIHPITLSQENVSHAREHFFQASCLAGPTSSLLSRKIMRSLALVTGPKVSDLLGYSASELLHSSIGSTARIQAMRVLESHPVLNILFAAFDIPLNEEASRHEFFQQFYTIGSKTLPSTWNFIAVSLCPAGEVLIATIRRSLSKNERTFVTDIVCIFPALEHEYSFNVVDDILVPFNNIMDRSNAHLSGSKEETNEINSNHPSAKEEWWAKRISLDMELKNLLTLIDEKLFNHHIVKELVMPKSHFDDRYVCDDLRHISGNLSLRFEAMCAVDGSDCTERSCFEPKDTTMPDTSIEPNDPPPAKCTDRVIFFVLDEYFHSLPLENLPTFIDSTICRIPSVPFAISRCYDQCNEAYSMPSIDLSNTTYVLDPESNLAETRARMHTCFENLCLNNGWKWNGFVGEIPPDETIEAALRRNNALYLFCGHGGGESVLPRTKFKNIFLGSGIDKGAHISPCQSALVLMGCSSGRIGSINAPKEEFAQLGEYHYEPDGAIISYLCAGAPCVVANLWDVTDRDIERYFKELLNLFVAGDIAASDLDESMSLAACVARARSACKLRYIVGCAPIVYGVPVYKL